MKNKLSALLLCLLCLFRITGVNTSAESGYADTAAEIVGGIVAFNQADGSVENWIDEKLSGKAGNGSEWYILTLSQYGSYDFTEYESNLLHYLSQNEVASASSRLKYALCLTAVGSRDSYITETAENAIGKQGIMSLIFGIHLLNNTDTDKAGEVISQLLPMQKPDGGWALMGEYGDVDVTAMAVQSLAPHYESNTDVKTAVDNALIFLSEKQKDDGDYASYGVNNPESTAQVIVALSALGIDCCTDSRFIKNGHTIFDGIEKYRLRNGSFCRELGKGSNETATLQAFYSMVAYIRFTEGKPSLYILDNAKSNDDNIIVPPTSSEAVSSKPVAQVAPAETEESSAYTTSDNPAAQVAPVNSCDNASKPPEYKVWAVAVIICVGGAVAIILIVLKKKSPKNYIVILAVTALAIAVVCVTDIKSAEEYYNGSTTKENIIGQVTMAICCDTIKDKSDLEYIPDNGIILDTSTFEIAADDTAYDILIEAARKYNIQVENEGSPEMAYISGINYIYEFDYGDLSGWMYYVNGTAPSVGCGEYKLSDGDSIVWQYTCELGYDL